MKFVTVAFCIIATQKVSLFTREWIEISIPTTQNQQENVSLFTREWIEIRSPATGSDTPVSPSLRGSGLKSFYRPVTDTSGNVSLFTREWIEIRY